jgi:hypothetical protein
MDVKSTSVLRYKVKRTFFTGLVCVLLSGLVFAQQTKPWNDWSRKDADKMLNDSAWGQTLKKGETPPDMSNRSGGSGSQGSGVQGPAPLPSVVYFRVRLITAKPIREGFASKLLLSQPNPTDEVRRELQTIIDNGFGDFIVVAVNVDGQNPQTAGMAFQELVRLKAATLADKVYLERKDGKRLPLIDYKPPIADNMGGKFVFARSLDGVPFLAPDTDSVRFVLDMSGNLKLNVKFKVSSMMYGDKLEY